jgi:hypothetical protein
MVKTVGGFSFSGRSCLIRIHSVARFIRKPASMSRLQTIPDPARALALSGSVLGMDY